MFGLLDIGCAPSKYQVIVESRDGYDSIQFIFIFLLRALNILHSTPWGQELHVIVCSHSPGGKG